MVKTVTETELRSLFKNKEPFYILVEGDLCRKVQEIAYSEKVSWLNGEAKEVLYENNSLFVIIFGGAVLTRTSNTYFDSSASYQEITLILSIKDRLTSGKQLDVTEEELRELFRIPAPFKFQIQVTEEESKRVQEIGFEEGITWFEEKKEVMYTQAPYLACKNKQYYFSDNADKSCGLVRLKHVPKEINMPQEQKKTKLVKTELSFSTEAEACKLMLEGYILKSEATEYRLRDGTFKSKNDTCLDLIGRWDSSGWEVYKEEQVEWFENIPPQGILCWTSGISGGERFLRIIVKKSLYVFIDKYDTPWRFAVPATAKDIAHFLVENN